MKSIKSLPSFAALALCLSVSSMASAATITPVNSAFTAPGTISVSSPASLNLPVTCNITFKGTTAADGSYASIDSVTVSGSNTLCSVPQMTGLPWKLTVSSTTAGKVDGVGFKILSSTCGSSTVNGSWSNATNTLSASNQSLAGNCKINSLSVQPTPAFVVNP
ncbi:alkane oxidation protein activator PraA [Pseudomonas aeruginosa]|uniref:alkane oxidation protein activator PraA n=1 Tax=Pseudomonas aeruginosa TaxID=287 RepID=UPI00148E008E|nr:alkane oxidation protein activator PraA [Pseudomonas aeruginosa]